jgi:hypothetical protein
VAVVGLLPVEVSAQEAFVTGTVTDSTGAVLPGVSVTAVLEATGNTFETVTDEAGIYRVPVRVGGYLLVAKLQGFATIERSGLQLLVGQTATVNLQMAPSTIEETVTVSADAPLLNVTTSSLGGNVDPQQVQELPVNGRNWVALALLAPGSRTTGVNAATPLPDRNGGEAREFQLNVDGQQVSVENGTGGQARFSQDSIAEFQFLSNRFDATQGRSSGVQVNLISKSGTNRFAGLVRGNFRDSRFNAVDPVLGRVVPINNQQLSTAVGGPVLRDRIHFFANYEYEREPRSSIWNTPYPAFNVELTGIENQKKGGLRLDYQVSPATRLMGKMSAGRFWRPFGAGASNAHPAATNSDGQKNDEYLATLTQVVSNRMLNELKGGYTVYTLDLVNLTRWSNHWQAPNGVTTGSPRITFTGFSIAGNTNHPLHQFQKVWSVRDDVTYSYNARGRHDVRAGAEMLGRHQLQGNCRQCMGTVTANAGPRPSDANLQAWFPDPFNADTWNMAAISSITRTYAIGVGDYNVHTRSKKIGAWLQDDWKLTNQLTLNLGLRYDLGINLFANSISLPPLQESGRPNDSDNIQPRLGFALSLNDRTVVRGGSGLYYGDALGNDSNFATGNTQIAVIQYNNDNRPDFAANPTNGQPLPTYDQALRQFCSSNPVAFGEWRARGFTGTAPCLLRAVQEFTAPHEYIRLPRSWQTSLGVQRQMGDTLAVTADYVYSQGRDEKDVLDNINLAFDPATGANYPVSDRARLPFPDWGVLSMNTHLGRSSYHALQTSFTRRFSGRWQASGTYTLAGLWNAEARPFSGLEPVPFETAADLGGEWGPSADDQRHRAVLNGIWQVGRGFQVSGLHFFAAGIRLATNYGGDLRATGAAFSGRLRPDGTIVPRNSLFAPAQNRTDLRVQQRVPLGRASIDAIAEVFNVFNRPNYGIGTQESSPNYLTNTSAQTRTMQFGFRLQF